MPMHREGPTVEMSLQAFDAVGARRQPEAATTARFYPGAEAAQSFKTVPAAWR